MARQQAVQQALPAQRRDEAYFRDRIGTADTAEKLVNDKRLLRIALTAFGLEGDVNSKAFIQKVLEGGTLKEGSLANRLANKQYQKLAAAFGYGDFSVPRTMISTFPEEILSLFRTRSFEKDVGTQNNTYRLALNAEREISDLATRSSSEKAKWYSLLANPPLREMIQTAFGLPKSFAAIDLDQQVATLRAKTEAAFGSPDLAQFNDPAKLDALIRRFVLRSEIQDRAGSVSPAATALALLRR
ncbi:DUF1217 domain-containing protein [Rhodobacter calidifons]|nr:DUF1217 domain-containing protein [Rhodobacter calidifons]